MNVGDFDRPAIRSCALVLHVYTDINSNVDHPSLIFYGYNTYCCPPRVQSDQAGMVNRKGCIVKYSKPFILKEVEVLVPDAINTVTPAMWKKLCDHAEKVEEEYWKKDRT